MQLAKICFVISFICFVPQLLFKEPRKSAPTLFHTPGQGSFKLGIENIEKKYIEHICPDGKPLGLVANLAHADGALDRLHEKQIVISKLFYADAPDTSSNMQSVGHHIESINISTKGFDGALHDIGALLVDLQDSGLGYGHSVSLIFQTLHAAARDQVPVIILDRPNVLGSKIEGSLLRPSDLNMHIPLRYGMTGAELAYFYNKHALEDRVRLHIVPMSNYDRSCVHGLDVCPSDSGAVDTIWRYSLCGLLAHVQPFDVGCDTTESYRCIALPRSVSIEEQKWYQLKIALRNIGIDSAICRYYSKQKKESCRGLRLHIKDMQKVDTFKALLVVLTFFKHAGVILHFSDQFDAAVGDTMVRRYIQGKIPKRVLADRVNQGLELFYRKAFGAFMYHPLPELVLI